MKNALRTLALSLVFALPLAAMAQWQWIDKNNQKIFSDRPPPADIPESKILKRPAATPRVAAAAAAAPASAASAPRAAASVARAAASGPAPSASAAAEAARRQAEEQRIAQEREGNCARAKAAFTTLSTGQRLRTTNAKGELEFMTDEARNAESKRLQGVMASDCKK